MLAHNKFTIQEIVAMHHGEAKLPSFIRDRKQLNKLEIQSSCILSSIRIFVEHVIGLL